ncbi:ABC-2 type transport system permease protein [Proteiniborus ethanoligenes]|uniref:ABC-2 type transport system permease protein n=1 Tax=Proteiniborus ethanoligenes TaxID=415015 RepID=A0A1H3NSI3_9FIRM|nr:ABC-2 family transporter protein [Proteiniborus ethanoligenes]SDY91650.1 ABC-2 type transport system permease protein [Proteiniborus ethanoligenes]
MGLFLTLFKASFKSEAQYRFDFLINILGNILGLLGDFIIVVFILMRFKNINGWLLHEVALMYSVIEFGFGMYRLIGDGFNNFELLILSGKFDTLLIRPAPALVQVMLQKVDLKRLGMVAQALGVGIWGLQRCSFINNSFYFYLPLLLLASVIINMQIGIILAAVAFWTGKNEDIVVLGHYSTRTAAAYPATIYNNIFRHILTFVIPFFSLTYYPLVYYTGRSGNAFYLLAPLFGIIAMTPISYLIWSLGIKRYSSTGT